MKRCMIWTRYPKNNLDDLSAYMESKISDGEFKEMVISYAADGALTSWKHAICQARGPQSESDIKRLRHVASERQTFVSRAWAPKDAMRGGLKSALSPGIQGFRDCFQSRLKKRIG